MLRKIIPAVVLCLSVLSVSLFIFSYDSEWPPAPDPINGSIPPGPGLLMGKVPIPIPTEFSVWLNHQHDVGGWSEFPGSINFGDIEGPDDGTLDAVISVSDEILLGGRVGIDWSTNWGLFTPLWCWKVPNAPASPPASHAGKAARNALIWDFDGDGKNEVAIVAPKWTGSAWGWAIYVVQTDPNPPAPPWAFSVPPPKILASSPASAIAQASEIHDRLGICKVRDTAYPMDIVCHGHDGCSVSIWRLVNNAGSYSLAREYSIVWQVPQTHEFNYADTDADGFDEFMWNGVLDFVDRVGGVATPTNGLTGVRRWTTGFIPYAHMDQMYCADYDPSHPGLEINSAPEEQYTDPDGIVRQGKDTLWTTDGHVLRENANCPFTHPQSLYSGNWSKTRPGFETIHVPKSWSNPTVRGNEIWIAGHYSVDAQQNELTVDGAYWKTVKLNPPANTLPILRATGPAYGMRAIDWDGDYSSDEIINSCWEVLYVWRMGEKGDWLPGPPPAGMPNAAQVQQPWVENGYTLWWEFYQGYNGDRVQQWGIDMINQYGGPGRYSHYFQKLGEAWPGHGLWFAAAFDVGKDYREEAIALTPNLINVFYNTARLSHPNLHPSPRTSKEYCRWRMDTLTWPFDYQSLPVNVFALTLKSLAGETIAQWDNAGNLTLKGTLTQSSTPARTSASEFVVKNNVGTVVAVITNAGNMVLAGLAYQSQSSITPPVGSFVVKDNNGVVVGCITQAGHMYLKGTVTTGG